MKVPSLVSMSKRCAYCNEPFRITEQGIEALPADWAGDVFRQAPMGTVARLVRDVPEGG